jgi:hypothetical protein
MGATLATPIREVIRLAAALSTPMEDAIVRVRGHARCARHDDPRCDRFGVGAPKLKPGRVWSTIATLGTTIHAGDRFGVGAPKLEPGRRPKLET